MRGECKQTKSIRKKYSPQFKDQALERAERDGVKKAAQDSGIPEAQLYSWRAKQRQGRDSVENQQLHNTYYDYEIIPS